MRQAELAIYKSLLENSKLENIIFKDRSICKLKIFKKISKLIYNRCKLLSSDFHFYQDNFYFYDNVPKKRINIYMNSVRDILAKMVASYIVASGNIKQYWNIPVKNIYIDDLYQERMRKDKEAKELEEWKKSSSIKYVNEKDLNLETKSDKNKKKWKILKDNKEWKVGGTI